MSARQLILRSLVHHWRMHSAVALGVMAATAVLTGALVVGDSVRGSLRHLTLDRLGRIDEALVTDRFFRAELAHELSAQKGFADHFELAVPAILLRATVERADGARRAAGVSLVGCPREFWSLGTVEPVQRDRPFAPPQTNQVVLNERLAEELGVTVGDEVIVRVAYAANVPADSPLGRKDDTVRSLRLSVSSVIRATALGRFSLQAAQQSSRNAFVELQTLQRALEQPGRANAIFVSRKSPTDAPTDDAAGLLNRLLKPTLDDYGLAIEQSDLGYFQLTTQRMLLEPQVEEAALACFGRDSSQSVFTYLANTLAAGEREIPYSTITAIDFQSRAPLGPFLEPAPAGQPRRAIGKLADDEIVLNNWAADDLQARPGDTIRVTFFEPQSTQGRLRERTEAFRLRAVVELAGAAADPQFTPTVRGVTDQAAIRNWDPPFPFNAARIRDADEAYWDQYGATPKAFVSLATGRRLWGSRFGRCTSVRTVPQPSTTAAALARSLKIEPAEMGFEFQPVKRLGLEASAGTTPFDLLFLSFSAFVIAAALMLVVLLFRLGVDTRAEELGILQAAGFDSSHVLRLLAAEGLVVAAIGGLAGVVAGVGFAWLLLAGLGSWWLDAISTPFLRLYFGWLSLAIGYGSGVVMSLGAIWWSLRSLRRVPARRLLARETQVDASLAPRQATKARYVARGALAMAIVLALAAGTVTSEAQIGAFFACGALILTSLLAWIWSRWARGATLSLVARGPATLWRLAMRNGARSPLRSTLTVGLVASATFIIVAVSAFRLEPPDRPPRLDSGDGGFALVAESDQPIHHNLNTPEGRAEFGLSNAASAALAGSRIIALRTRAGDDASCLNLYQPRRPRVLGVPNELIERGGFAWASPKPTAKNATDIWRQLRAPLPTTADGTKVVPVVIDENTARYSLHLWKGVGETYTITDGRGRPVTLQVVGLVKNSIFQGDLLVSESAFLELYPDTAGYQFFLVETPPDRTSQTQRVLERALADYGFDAQQSRDRLAGFFAVQNTYLATFQSLGALGLLLGTFGLATVQLRNVIERRGELALLQATGYRRRRVARLVIAENALLLGAGLAVGLLSAAVAVAPHLAGGGAAIPWSRLAAVMAIVFTVGTLAGLAAAWSAAKAPLLPALRGD